MFNNQHLTRQMDILPPEKTTIGITVIGAGAIGSFTTLALAKMGFGNITVYDFDTIEIENMNCQFYRHSDIGKPKVNALQELVRDFTGVEITAINDRYKGGSLGGIVISAVDSMAIRKLIYEGQKDRSPFIKRLIDPRMGAEVALMYVMNPMNEEDQNSYEKTLHSDEDGVHERCTAKATMYTACMLSGLVAKAVKDIAVDYENTPRIVQWSIKDNDFKCFTQRKSKKSAKGVA